MFLPSTPRVRHGCGPMFNRDLCASWLGFHRFSLAFIALIINADVHKVQKCIIDLSILSTFRLSELLPIPKLLALFVTGGKAAGLQLTISPSSSSSSFPLSFFLEQELIAL